ADDPKAFAEAVVRLYTDKALWERLSAGAMNFVRQNYARENGQKWVREILASVGLVAPDGAAVGGERAALEAGYLNRREKPAVPADAAEPATSGGPLGGRRNIQQLVPPAAEDGAAGPARQAGGEGAEQRGIGRHDE